MPCVADNRKCSPPAVENKEHASGNFKDLFRDRVGFILYVDQSQVFHPNYLKVIAYFTDFPELKSGDGRQNDQQTSDPIGNSHMSDISSNASTLSEESTNTVLEDEKIVTRALIMLGDESGSNRISNSSGIQSGSDSQVERLTELLNRTKVNSTHSCLQCLDDYYYCHLFGILYFFFRFEV